MDDQSKRALSHPKRVEIFNLLVQRSDGRGTGEQGTGEQELAEAFGMSIRLLDYHLKVLHDAKLIANAGAERELGSGSASYVATGSL